ncbi:MAG: DUF3048 domain-containing protein [Candidatus Kerfeldbacteria bacterium]|nr:DUF3048 domain-containing protein [Candidatus Kerfeldbacteria bacterium]
MSRKKKTEQHSSHKHILNFLHGLKKPTPKEWLISVLVLMSLAVMIIPFVVRVPRSTEARELTVPEEKTKKKKPEAEQSIPTTAPRRIDGVVVDAAAANPLTACVMVENAAFGGVRPQSGLSQASVVYEVIVEGGITRFMAVYAGATVPTIGPVRSARDNYLQFASEYNCAYFHAGGSDTALRNIPSFKLRDVDALREYSFFWRDNSRYAPHNLFTSSDNLQKAIETHSWNTLPPQEYTSWKFVDPVDAATRPDPTTDQGVERVFIGFGGSYDVEYHYNSTENVYERSNGGQPHTDANTGEIVKTKNIIVERVGYGESLPDKGRVNWPVEGEGDVLIFHDGAVLSGKWKKPDRLSRTEFFDADGNPLSLVVGNSWVEIAPPQVTVEYQ